MTVITTTRRRSSPPVSGTLYSLPASLPPIQQHRQSPFDIRPPKSSSSSSATTSYHALNDPSPNSGSSAGRGVVIGLLSAFGSAAVVALFFAVIYFFRYTSRGRILLDRIGRPGEYDDEQARAKEEAEALETMDEISRQEYLRAKGMLPAHHRHFYFQLGADEIGKTAFVEANPPESVPTDISLSQFLAIQEKGVSAWEFEAELEIANCFVEQRTEVEFFDSECSVQSNLPVPKQNEVYYWEAKLYDKPDSTLVSIGMTTKPYPMFRLPGEHLLTMPASITSKADK
jgi:hypothetical protein